MGKQLLKTSHKKEHALLSYAIIEAAAKGDVDAINTVLKHYEGYISAMAARILYDENGISYSCVDPELKRRLETKLITRILKFKI